MIMGRVSLPHSRLGPGKRAVAVSPTAGPPEPVTWGKEHSVTLTQSRRPETLCQMSRATHGNVGIGNRPRHSKTH